MAEQYEYGDPDDGVWLCNEVNETGDELLNTDWPDTATDPDDYDSGILPTPDRLPAIETSPEAAETDVVPPRRRLQELSEQLKRIGRELDVSHDKLVAAVRGQGHEAYEQFTTELDRCRQQSRAEWSTLEHGIAIAHRLGVDMTEVVDPQTQSFIDSARVLTAQTQELAANEYIQARQELIERVDWQQVFKHAIEHGIARTGPLSVLLGSLGDTSQYHLAGGYWHTLSLLTRYEHFQTECRDRQMLREPSDIPPVPAEWQPNNDIVGTVISWKDDVDKAWPLLAGERQQALKARRPDAHTVDMVSVVAYALGINVSNCRPSATVRYGLEQAVETLQQELCDADRRYRRQRRPPVTYDADTHGPRFAELTGMTPEQLFRTTLRRHPADLVRGVSRIVLNSTLGIKRFPNGKEMATAAQMDGANRTMSFSMDTMKLKSLEEVPGEADMHSVWDAAARRIAQAHNADVYRQWGDHELGHHAHFHTAPIDWLMRWLRHTRQTPYDVTDYVTISRSESEAAGEKEDLADSVEEYLHRPWRLYHEEKGRFNLLQELYGRYRPEKIEALKIMLRDPDTDTLDELNEQQLDAINRGLTTDADHLLRHALHPERRRER